MHILFESRPFYPSVGGMETVARQLAEAWYGQGHTVKVVTQTPLENTKSLDTIDTIRQPSLATWWQLLQNADIFVQSGISLKSLPLGLLSGTPIVFIHHNMLPTGNSTVGIRNQLKRWVAHLGPNIAVSSAVARDLPSSRTIVIHNPFEPYFTSTEFPDDPHHLLFIGRLVSVKGADVALRALAQLNTSYTLTLCGDGPERDELEQLTTTLGLGDRVTFEGWVDHGGLRSHVQRASIQLVPSRYEPFGIVALEAIAAGCAVVASDTGGLPEAVGPCGILVPPDDPAVLAQGVKRAVASREELLAFREEHLAQFDIDVIAEQYLEVFRRVVGL